MTTYRSDSRLDREVYRPAEDSVLLADTAIELVRPGWTVVDTGTGSGFVAERLQSSMDVTVIGTDINPHACLAATERGISSVRGWLLDPIETDAIDAAMFNPPYLPADERLPDDWLTHAVTGGIRGDELIRRWIDDLPRVLREGGVGICLVSSATGLDGIRSSIDSLPLTLEVHEERRWSFETLTSVALYHHD